MIVNWPGGMSLRVFHCSLISEIMKSRRRQNGNKGGMGVGEITVRCYIVHSVSFFWSNLYYGLMAISGSMKMHSSVILVEAKLEASTSVVRIN
jgi:hypothetical protein